MQSIASWKADKGELAHCCVMYTGEGAGGRRGEQRQVCATYIRTYECIAQQQVCATYIRTYECIAQQQVCASYIRTYECIAQQQVCASYIRTYECTYVCTYIAGPFLIPPPPHKMPALWVSLPGSEGGKTMLCQRVERDAGTSAFRTEP